MFGDSVLRSTLVSSNHSISSLFNFSAACACKAQKLDSKNIFKNVVETNKYYYNVTTSVIKTPELRIDDCSVSMYCEEDYRLFVFDTDKDEYVSNLMSHNTSKTS